MAGKQKRQRFALPFLFVCTFLLFRVSAIRQCEYCKTDERQYRHHDCHQVILAEAFGQFLEYKEQYYDVRYRDEQQYEPPQRFAEFFQQYVEVVDRNESLPEGTSHFFNCP